jgi:hypothetical protein
MAGERSSRLVERADGVLCCVDERMSTLREWGAPVYYAHAPGHLWCQHCWPPRGRGRGEGQFSARRLEARRLRARAIALRVEQYLRDQLSYAEIGKACGRSKTWAYYAVTRALDTRREGDSSGF